MSLIDIHEHRTRSGKRPFLSWIMGLNDLSGRARILARIDRLAMGNFGDVKFLSDGLFELRFHMGPGYRVYFGRLSANRILLLGGGDKSSQGKDIPKARARWKDHRSQP